jgi:hypothetical protein
LQQEKKKKEEADAINLAASISSMYHCLSKASDEYGNNPITIGDWSLPAFESIRSKRGPKVKEICAKMGASKAQ